MDGAAVLHANYYQFAPGQRVENLCVGSRMLLWCRMGQGEVVVDGQGRALPADAWLLLPWRHRVVYQADRRHPFLVAGIHLCPEHAPGDIELRVPHRPDDPLHASPRRRDARWPGLDGLPGGGFDACPRLRDLAEWMVARWTAAPVDAAQARAMGALLADELRRSVGRSAAAALPPALAAAVRAAEAGLARPLDLTALARAAGCSAPTLVRLFRRHLMCAPMAWLRGRRLEEARRLLAGGSLPVAEVGRRVGIADAQRFAKLFRAAVGVPPRAWRVRQRL